jgi:hypothetical protein
VTVGGIDLTTAPGETIGIGGPNRAGLKQRNTDTEATNCD